MTSKIVLVETIRHPTYGLTSPKFSLTFLFKLYRSHLLNSSRRHFPLFSLSYYRSPFTSWFLPKIFLLSVMCKNSTLGTRPSLPLRDYVFRLFSLRPRSVTSSTLLYSRPYVYLSPRLSPVPITWEVVSSPTSQTLSVPPDHLSDLPHTRSVRLTKIKIDDKSQRW